MNVCTIMIVLLYSPIAMLQLCIHYEQYICTYGRVITITLIVIYVQGIFRFASEHTLRVMRRGRETLLTLLEAFVYDPLVDWRAGADTSIASYGACQARARCTGVGRKQLEQELTRAMFAVRTAEMRAEWLANR